MTLNPVDKWLGLLIPSLLESWCFLVWLGLPLCGLCPWWAWLLLIAWPWANCRLRCQLPTWIHHIGCWIQDSVRRLSQRLFSVGTQVHLTLSEGCVLRFLVGNESQKPLVQAAVS